MSRTTYDICLRIEDEPLSYYYEDESQELYFRVGRHKGILDGEPSFLFTQKESIFIEDKCREPKLILELKEGVMIGCWRYNGESFRPLCYPDNGLEPQWWEK